MKKFLISSIIFSIILFSLSCINFAANVTGDVKNIAGSVGNTISNTANGAKNVIGNTENAVENGAANAKNTIMGTTENVADDAKNMTGSVENGMSDMIDDYTAERTSTASGFMGMSATTWTWLILGIVGLAIVGLVWYYGSQYEHTDYMDGE